jgi:TRAP-type C4-dicarboxylate transport system permease small subunit
VTRKRVLRIVLLAGAGVCFLFAIFVWLNIDADLSAAYFSGDALDFARYIWVEINLMLVALAIGAVALLIALQENLLAWRARPRRKGDGADKVAADKGDAK